MSKVKPLVSAIAIASLSMGALAQTQMSRLEETLVTAQKRTENLQDVPIAVTAFTSDTIQLAGINNAVDVANLTPSLSMLTNLSPFTTTLFIRGIGTAQNDPSLEPSVGMFVDGVFIGRTGLGMSDLTDIERIEVLQGPQGTLYGKNSNAGAISVITKRPNLEEFEGYVEATVGDYSMGQLTAVASGPLGDTVAFRLSGSIHERDGYFDNAGADDLNDADDWNLQGKLLWEPTDSLSFLLSASHIDRDTNCCGADAIQDDVVLEEYANRGLPADKNDPYDYDMGNDLQNEFSLESDIASLHIKYDAGWGEITSITAWNDYDWTSSTDGDFGLLNMIHIIDEYNEGDSFSQELRLDSSFGDNIDYMLGLFYYEQTTQRGDASPTVILGPDFLTIASQVISPALAAVAAPGDYGRYKNTWDNETVAVFGQATWHITDRWHLTGGLRWTDEEREAELFGEAFSTAPVPSGGGPSFLDGAVVPIDDTFNRDSDNVDWLLKLAFDISDNSMVYASAATGSKSGNFNGVGGSPEQREFDDEDTISYELGLKSTLLDSRLRLNAAAFYTEVEDYQYQAENPVGVGTFVSTDGEIQVSGVDLQMEAVPLPNLTLTAGLLYMHDYEITDGPRDGQDLNFTADWSGNLGAMMVFPLADSALYLRADYIFMDDHITGASAFFVPDEQIDDRELVNARIGWRNDNWNVSVWGKNLTDDEYSNWNPGGSISGADVYFLAPPRTYGATVRYHF
jgi:iron complex outermembrane recepter protein